MSVDQYTQFFINSVRIVNFSAKPPQSMKNNLLTMKKALFAAFTLFIFSQCTEEEIVPNQVQASTVETASLAEATGSMTISGIYTIYDDIKDCTTCTYLVPADMAVVDGKELNLKAGSVICLDKAIQYGDVEFINLEGTEESPIKIGASMIVTSAVK